MSIDTANGGEPEKFSFYISLQLNGKKEKKKEKKRRRKKLKKMIEGASEEEVYTSYSECVLDFSE